MECRGLSSAEDIEDEVGDAIPDADADVDELVPASGVVPMPVASYDCALSQVEVYLGCNFQATRVIFKLTALFANIVS